MSHMYFAYIPFQYKFTSDAYRRNKHIYFFDETEFEYFNIISDYAYIGTEQARVQC